LQHMQQKFFKKLTSFLHKKSPFFNGFQTYQSFVFND